MPVQSAAWSPKASRRRRRRTREQWRLFHDHTRDGKVERGDDSDKRREGATFPSTGVRTLGRHGASVELPGETDGELADVDHLLYLAESLEVTFPASNVTISARSSLCSVSKLPSRRTTAPRAGAGTVRQVRNAR